MYQVLAVRVCKPFNLETQRLLSDSVLWGFMICAAVEQCGRNLVVQSRRFGISKHAHYFRSKCLREGFLYSDTCQDYLYFTSQMFQAFPAQIPTFSEKNFRCLSQAITLKFICRLGFFPLACPANSPLLDCRSWLANFTLYRYTAIQDFESCDHKDFKCQLNTCHVVPLWQISAETLQVFLLDGLKRFILKLPNLILKLQFQKLHWSLGVIKISLFCELLVTDIFWQVLEGSDNRWQHGQVGSFQNPRVCLFLSVFLPLPLFPLFGSRTAT